MTALAVDVDVDVLIQKLRAGDIGSLARAISILEDERPGFDKLMRDIRAIPPRANVLGFTGPPGSGKSTLIDALVHEFRAQGLTVAVLAVDPSSPKSGGAVLGDRIRMNDHVLDPGVYTRSLGARGHLGGVSKATRRIVELLRRSGRDVVIIETVGTGQSEVEIASIADVSLVLSAPGLGDDIQAIKAGLLEIADIMVVNKSDLPAARSTANHLTAMLGLRSSNRDIPVMMTAATRKDGVGELAQLARDLLSELDGTDRDAAARLGLRNMLAEYVGSEICRRLLHSEQPAMERLVQAYVSGESSFAELTDLALESLPRR